MSDYLPNFERLSTARHASRAAATQLEKAATAMYCLDGAR
jgi:hypothetical protein